MFKGIRKHFQYGQRGFTLIELLVVVAILGALAAAVVPNVGKFMKSGQAAAKQTELHDIQTATMALMADSSTGQLDSAYSNVTVPNLSTVHSTNQTAGDLSLSSYITTMGTQNLGMQYNFDIDGKVTQH